MVDFDALKAAVIKGKRDDVVAIVNAAIAEKADVNELLDKGMIPAMREIGDKFSRNEAYVPELLIAARAMQSGLALLEPLITASGRKSKGKVAIGTVKGDLHDIGKSLVAMMLEGAGFEVMDLGVDVAPEKFVEALQNGAQIVAMSALLTTTMSNMKATIDAIAAAGLRDKALVMVGGAPVTQAYADQVGADGYAPDASAAVRKARELIAS